MNRDTRIFIPFALLGLLLYLWGLNGQITRTPHPRDIPAEITYPAQVEGVEIDSARNLIRFCEGFPQGTELLVQDANGLTHRMVLTLRYGWSYGLVVLLSGLFYWAVGFFVFGPRGDREGARILFWGTLVYGAAITLGGNYFPRDPRWADLVRGTIWLFAASVLPVLFVRFTLAFPRRSGFLNRRRWVMPALYALGVSMWAWQSVAYFRYAAAPGPGTAFALDLSHRANDGLMVAMVGVAFLILLGRSRWLELTREQQQVKWLLLGFGMGVFPYVFFRTFLEFLGLAPPLAPIIDRVFELAIPVVFLIAIFKYQLLDVDVLIRRSLIYGGLVAAVLAVIVAVGVMVGDRLNPAILVGIGLTAGIAFVPLRTTLGKWVDRTFFKISANYERVQAIWRKRAAHFNSPQELSDGLTRLITSTLEPEGAAVVLMGDPLITSGTVPADQLGRALERTLGKPDPSRAQASPGATSIPEIEDAPLPEELSDSGVAVLMPLETAVGLRGLIMVGPKRTGYRYIEPDLQFLRNVAEAAAAALERMELAQAVAEEALARRQLAELDRLKSEFLSRVAHDLRTPLTSITWSSENLLDGVTGPLEPGQGDYVRSIRAAADHMRRLVDNLLEISRLERGEQALDLHPTDLSAILTQAVETLHPLAVEKQVTLSVEHPEPVPPAIADASKLLEVAVNLLDNAVRYSPPGETVTLHLECDDEGAPGFTVRDRGPGFGDTDPLDLFQQFKQGAPSPHASRQGFGLGLHIANAYTERMSGRLTARNHPQGGAEFTCRLSAADPTGKDAHESQHSHRR